MGRYEYALSVNAGMVTVNATSIYGAHYALESMQQLVVVDPAAGLASVQHSAISIRDAPQCVELRPCACSVSLSLPPAPSPLCWLL